MTVQKSLFSYEPEIKRYNLKIHTNTVGSRVGLSSENEHKNTVRTLMCTTQL
jgi:hypothetical protein